MRRKRFVLEGFKEDISLIFQQNLIIEEIIDVSVRIDNDKSRA